MNAQWQNRFAVFVISLVVGWSTTPGTSRRGAGLSAPAEHPAFSAEPGLDLAFERNEGQHAAGVRYFARGLGHAVWLFDSAVMLTLRDQGGASVRLTMRFAQGDAPAGEAPLRGKPNYFLGRDDMLWRTNVPLFGRVRYRAVVPGIDLTFSGRDQRLEYGVVVKPGSDPRRVRIAFEGADRIQVNSDGGLSVAVLDRELQYSRPVAYQQCGGHRLAIDIRYVVEGLTVSYDAARYDQSQELVIDPVLVVSN
jgi:hypothetical protein